MTKYERKTADQRVAELEAKIAGIREREERRKAKNDPVVRETRAALKAMDRAIAAATQDDVRNALKEVRARVEACVKAATIDATIAPAAPQPQRRTRRNATAKAAP